MIIKEEDDMRTNVILITGIVSVVIVIIIIILLDRRSRNNNANLSRSMWLRSRYRPIPRIALNLSMYGPRYRRRFRKPLVSIPTPAAAVQDFEPIESIPTPAAVQEPMLIEPCPIGYYRDWCNVPYQCKPLPPPYAGAPRICRPPFSFSSISI